MWGSPMWGEWVFYFCKLLATIIVFRNQLFWCYLWFLKWLLTNYSQYQARFVIIYQMFELALHDNTWKTSPKYRSFNLEEFWSLYCFVFKVKHTNVPNIQQNPFKGQVFCLAIHVLCVHRPFICCIKLTLCQVLLFFHWL